MSIDVLSARVRELVRERRVDPRSDAAAVEQAALDAVAEHETLSLTGRVRSLDNPEVVVGQLVTDMVGFGPLQQFLDDPEIEEIWINRSDRIFIARAGRHELTALMLTPDQVRELIERMLSSSGRRLDISQPFVDAMLPGGHRLHVVLEGITRDFTAVNIRKFVKSGVRIDDLVESGSMTDEAAHFLRRCIVAGLNVLVSGGTQAGKTTMLNALCAAIPGSQRLISVEEVFELECGRHPDWVAMQCRQSGLEGTGEITLRTLVKEALRMRPNRVVVGEVRSAEALDLLLALNSGLPGMASIHANSARQALVKLCTLPLLAGQNISADFVVPTVASTVDLVVHVGMDGDGHRAVREIVATTGRAESGVIETEPVFLRRHGVLERAGGAPARRDAFEAAGIAWESLWAC